MENACAHAQCALGITSVMRRRGQFCPLLGMQTLASALDAGLFQAPIKGGKVVKMRARERIAVCRPREAVDLPNFLKMQWG